MAAILDLHEDRLNQDCHQNFQSYGLFGFV